MKSIKSNGMLAGALAAAVIVALVVVFILTRSGDEQPAASTDTGADGPAMVSEEPAQAGGDEATEETASSDTLEVVEESAAEPEDNDQEAIILARADSTAATMDFEYEEGVHYTRLVPTQPTVGGADKIEVVEVFWYGCPHCLTLEPFIDRWEETKPASVRLERVPAMWNDVLRKHAQLFYTEQALVRGGAIADPDGFRASVFEAYHRRGNRLLTDEAILAHFERFGVSKEDFDKAWNSFEVAQQMRKASDLTRRYGVSSVPAIIVNGKFRSGGQQAGGYDELIEVIDELIVREGAR